MSPVDLHPQVASMTLIFGGVKENFQVPGEAVEEGSTLMVITYQVSGSSSNMVLSICMGVNLLTVQRIKMMSYLFPLWALFSEI